MHFRSPFLLFIFGLFSLVLFGATPTSTQAALYRPSGDLFEVSFGFNYLHVGDAYPETEDMLGFNLSAFFNVTPRLSIGGEFLGDFGESHYHYFGAVKLESERLFYLFGPRFNVWQNARLRVFAEGLIGGVHAEVNVVHSPYPDRTVSDGDFAAALGGGLDWRFTQHFSWRVVQADYLPTHLGGQWQNNLRIATALVYSFGER